MPFHFTLSGVLRLRQSLERAELQRLQSIAAAMARVRDEIDSLQQEMDASDRRMSDVIAGSGMTGAELHFELALQAGLLALRAELWKKLSDLETQRKDQQARYLQSRMQREILSNLRKRKSAEYELDQSRRIQQRIDELFLIRSSSLNK
jgi:flagellar export protein FliJ